MLRWSVAGWLAYISRKNSDTCTCSAPNICICAFNWHTVFNTHNMSAVTLPYGTFSCRRGIAGLTRFTVGRRFFTSEKKQLWVWGRAMATRWLNSGSETVTLSQLVCSPAVYVTPSSEILCETVVDWDRLLDRPWFSTEFGLRTAT